MPLTSPASLMPRTKEALERSSEILHFIIVNRTVVECCLYSGIHMSHKHFLGAYEVQGTLLPTGALSEHNRLGPCPWQVPRPAGETRCYKECCNEEALVWQVYMREPKPGGESRRLLGEQTSKWIPEGWKVTRNATPLELTLVIVDLGERKDLV